VVRLPAAQKMHREPTSMNSETKPWTPEAGERLRLAVIGGKTLAEISGTLGRSVPAVKARAYKLGLGLRVIGTSRRALAKWG
jgi:hypothetical protein